MRHLTFSAYLLGAGLLISSSCPALATSMTKPVGDAIARGSNDGSACLPQGAKATFDDFRACIARHDKAPPMKAALADSYRLGLQAQSWLLVNLQSLKAMDVADKASGNDKASAQKSANVLQEAAHDYFVAMRRLQKKTKIADPALCDALGLPYEKLKDYFDFYDHWQ